MAQKKKTRSETDKTTDFFEPDRLKDFIRYIEDRDIAEIEIKIGESSVYISKNLSPAAVPAAPPAPVRAARVQTAPVPMTPVAPAPPAAPVPAAVQGPALAEITAPLVGTFYASASPKDPPFVKVGDVIKKGQTVCIVEAMKVFNSIPSEISGVVREVCVKNEQPVEYGQILFRVEAQ